MPFTSDKNKKGRPKGTLTTGYNLISTSDNKKYHGDAVREHRKRLAQNQKPPTPAPVATDESAPSDELPSSSSSKRGRKPLFDKPITPTTARRRKLLSQRTIRQKQRAFHKRSKISRSLWEKKKSPVASDSEPKSDTDHLSDEANPSDNDTDSERVDTEGEENQEQLPSDSEHEPSEPSVSTATEYRYRTKLVGCLTSNPIDNLNMFVCFLNTIQLPCTLRSEVKKLAARPCGLLNQRQLQYRVNKFLHQVLISEQTLTMISKYWLGLLFQHRYIEVLFSDASINISPNYLPKSFVVSREAATVAKELVTSRKNVSERI